MSQKTAKKFRRVARKTFRYHYNEFLKDLALCTLADRLRIARTIIKQREKKGGPMDAFIDRLYDMGIAFMLGLAFIGLASCVTAAVYFIAW